MAPLPKRLFWRKRKTGNNYAQSPGQGESSAGSTIPAQVCDLERSSSQLKINSILLMQLATFSVLARSSDSLSCMSLQPLSIAMSSKHISQS
jgi:hypothetical protein